MMSLKVPAVAAASVLLLVLSGAAHAQTTKKIVLKNVAPTSGVGADGKEVIVGVGERAAIPFQGEATLDENGNVLIDCTSASNCPNIGAGTAAVQAPTLTFGALPDPVPDNPTPAAMLTWTSNGATCYGKEVLRDGSAYVAPNWEKSWPATTNATTGYSLTSLPRSTTVVTEYKLTLECRSAPTSIGPGATAVGIRQETITVRLAKASATNSCETHLATLSQTERDKYYAYLPENRGFQQLPQTLAAYSGKTLGGPAPSNVGGIPGGIPGDLLDKQYRALSFSLAAGQKATIEMKQEGGGNPSFKPLAITISPCPGDFRPRDYASSDSFVNTASCRTQGLANGLNAYLRTYFVSGGCTIAPGQTYYLNVARQDTMLDPGSDPQNPVAIPPVSCAPAVGNNCGLSMGFRND